MLDEAHERVEGFGRQLYGFAIGVPQHALRGLQPEPSELVRFAGTCPDHVRAANSVRISRPFIRAPFFFMRTLLISTNPGLGQWGRAASTTKDKGVTIMIGYREMGATEEPATKAGPRFSLTRYVFTGAVVGLLSLTGTSAYAGCANPGLPGQHAAVQPLTPAFIHRGDDGRHAGRILNRIVGTWHVVYTGALAGQAFIQWHDDGTEWENIDYPILGGTVCMGDWRATDDNHVSRSHVGWLFTNGTPSGYFTETETDEVAADGSWYHGTNYAKFYDLDGNMFAEAGGTARATRISPP